MDLRSCYFCGTVGDALDTYALPRDDAADSVRVTLCTDCHAKLDRVLDAVESKPAERAEAEPAEQVESAPADADDAPSSAPDATFRGTGEVTFGDPDSSATGAETGDDETDDTAAVASSTATGAGDADADEETERDEATESDDAVAGSDVADAEAVDAAAATADRASDDAAESAAGESTTAGDGLRGLDPDDRGRVATYRKALRLLQNREFPMERAAVVDLLGSAYDLDRSECDRLLDFAVEKGLLVEEGEELRRP